MIFEINDRVICNWDDIGHKKSIIVGFMDDYRVRVVGMSDLSSYTRNLITLRNTNTFVRVIPNDKIELDKQYYREIRLSKMLDK